MEVQSFTLIRSQANCLTTARLFQGDFEKLCFTLAKALPLQLFVL